MSSFCLRQCLVKWEWEIYVPTLLLYSQKIGSTYKGSNIKMLCINIIEKLLHLMCNSHGENCFHFAII